jgi:hypothetical protein
MRISSRAWRKYQQAHAKVREAGQRELEEYFRKLPWDTDENRALLLLQSKAIELVERYGPADATLSAGMYDEIMAAQSANVPLAEVAATSPVAEIGADIGKAFKRATSSESAQVLTSQVVGRHIKRCGIRTMRDNAARDHAMWAWVCIGDTCAFCRALGSNGWQDASRKVLRGSHADHIHANCDCDFMVKMPGETLDIEGYDPESLLDEYEETDGMSSQDRINAMRRADYTAEYAEQRNTRRRELYALAHPESDNGTANEQS